MLQFLDKKKKKKKKNTRRARYSSERGEKGRNPRAREALVPIPTCNATQVNTRDNIGATASP